MWGLQNHGIFVMSDTKFIRVDALSLGRVEITPHVFGVLSLIVGLCPACNHA